MSFKEKCKNFGLKFGTNNEIVYLCTRKMIFNSIIMKALEDRIKSEGRYLPGGILKVDGFIDHQIDPQFMMEVGRELARLFKDKKEINKIVTIESSGIAPAVMTGLVLGVPVVFAKKEKPNTMEECYSTTARSFTKAKNCNLIISKQFLCKDDVVLFVDDFLSAGNTTIAALELCRMAGAKLVGAAFMIEKEFMQGRLHIHEQFPDLKIESLAIVQSREITEQDEKFMRIAIEASIENVKNGGGPFGAAIVKDGKLVATGVNRVTANNDPTAHAEVSAIRNACKKLGSFSLDGCVIYTSCEPCPMCLSAIYWSGIRKIYYGNTAIDARDINFDDQFIYDEIDIPADQRSIPSICVLRHEAQQAFRDWKLKVDKIEY